MEKLTIKLNNPDGLHARPAAIFIQVASKYTSDLEIEAHGVTVNGKSIIGIMSLGAFHGEEITLIAKGQDEKQMIQELKNLIENQFEGY
ncbi:HPr family phosphocarrier protein [Tissierella sp. Yu-01]|uniref:HPr family phosphocarrier protein n=1 Tax=Tissierella sp. Yu-01 TaxID=3035694 RepID=UPI00240E65CC|nr:HPr family phosphocarrier protein [Tissierella sp. Yu-01]WFA09169.1 HPr family phosphocarrier protein [Tissierella sp. Yu-01]